MLLTQWLRQLRQRWSLPGGNRRRHAGRALTAIRPRVRPQLEALEDRLTPSGNALGFTPPAEASHLQQGSANFAAIEQTASPSSSAPSITAQPTNQTVTSGQSATFTAAASGSPAPTVQWQASTDGGKTFSDIIDATHLTLTLNHVSTSLSGEEFRAVFTNSSGSATSNAATLTVNPLAPTVRNSPNSKTVGSGNTVTFAATASGDPTPTVQWQVSTDGGKTFTNISGATNATLTLSNVTTAANGDEFRAVFTNSGGSATSNAATLTVNPLAPQITTEPTSKTVAAGSNVSFTASASGDPTPTVQWLVSTDGGKTFSNLNGATNPTLTLSSVTLAMSGEEFRALFTNSAGHVASDPALLTVTAAPSITTQPSNQTVTAGQSATFTATASGGPTPTVQWQVSTDDGKTFHNLNGTTNTTLTLSSVTTTANGDEFRAVFTNSGGSATSNAATLTVNPLAPSITTQPTNQTVTAGQTVTFTAAASGDPTPTVQWQVSTDNGKTFTNLSGANGSTLTVNHVSTVFNGDEFRAIFTNSAGSATTNIVTLTINPLAPGITTQPSDRTVTSGNNVTFTAAASGDPTPTVQWQVSTDNGKTFTNITGATNATLALNNVTTAASGDEFRAVFTNSAGTATTNAATLTVNPLAPKITSQPSNQTVTAGSSVSFTATANGDPAPTVQWQVSTDGGNTFNNLTGANSITLTLTNVSTDLNGAAFRAVFTNSAGTVASRAVTLTVHAPPSSGGGSSSSQNPTLAPPALHIPPLLAFFNSLLTVKETVNANGTVTLTDSFFGFPLLVATFNSSGNLESVTIFGINVTVLFELPL